MIKMVKKNWILFSLILIIVVSSLWMLTKGMPYAHDIAFHYTRLVGLTNSLKTGDFIALIHNSFYGYGYANGIFYGNFYFYIPALLCVLGIPYMISFKIFYLLINALTALSIYFCTKSIVKDKKISLITTILYMFSMYRIIDIFVRGAMGEMLAFMVIPIIILGLYEIVYRDYKKWYYFTIGFVLLLLAHLISTALIAAFSLIFIIVNYKKLLADKKRILYLFVSGGVGLLLGAFFLFPIIEQKLHGSINIFVNGSYFQPRDEVVNLLEFILPTDFFNKFLGYSLILLFPIRKFISKNKLKEENKNLLRFADILAILSIIAWICTTGLFPWDLLNNTLEFIQFPWRLLIVATTFLTFANCIYIKILTDNKAKKVLKYTYIVILVISFVSISLYSVQYGIRKIQYNEFNDNEIGGGEYLLSNTNLAELDYESPLYITNNPDLAVNVDKDGTSAIVSYKYNYQGDTFIEIPLFNYLGYKAVGADIETNDNGLIKLTNLKPNGVVTIKYEMTNIQKISYMVSVISLIGFVGYLIIERKK